MKNEITRKITSLTLLTILLASGVTFAVPGAMPAAEAAHNANLFVSAESSIFKNTFGGPMVVEIVINDPALTDTDEAKGEPDVTVNGKDVRLVQGTDGLWYAYIADKTQADLADSLSFGTALGTDFGTPCDNNADVSGSGSSPDPSFSDTVGIYVDGVPVTAPATCSFGNAEGGNTGTFVHVVREPKSPNTNIALSGNTGQINIDTDAWPFIQLYNFNPTGSVEIKYNKGGGAQVTTLTFDTLDTYSKLSLDRTTYTTGSEVDAVLTDGQLNIDPTDEDSWTFATNPAATQTHYQLFNENGAADSDGVQPSTDLAPFLSQLMFEDNGIVKLNPGIQGTVIVALDDNDDQILNPDGNVALSATGGGTLAAGTQPMTFVETGANTGSFTNYDESDNSNLDILLNAARGTSASLDYNKKAYSIVVGFGFGTLAFAAPTNGVWNSGEELPITLVDSDANRNSRADEDLDLNNPNVGLIPALRIGAPATLALGIVDAGSDLAGTTFVNSNGGTFIDTTDGAINGVQQFSDRAMLQLDEGASIGDTDVLALEFGTWADFYKASPINNPNFKGFTLLNYDVRSLANVGNAVSIESVDIQLEGCPIATNQPLIGHVTIDMIALEDCFDNLSPTFFVNGPVTIVQATNTVTATFTDAGVAGLDAGAELTAITGAAAANFVNGQVTITQGIYTVTATFTDAGAAGLDAGAELTAFTGDANSTFQLGELPVGTSTIDVDYIINTTPVEPIASDTVLPIVTDIFGFGLIGDGLKTIDRINNSIYRFELEETGDNTSTFIGSGEFTMLNQLNIFDAATYSGLRTIDDEVTFIVHEDLDDEEAPRVNYLDLGADGVSTQIAAQEDAGTNSGVVAFDKDAYKVADTVTVTLTDADLNVDSDLIDIYVTVPSSASPDPATDAVGKVGLGTYADGSSFGRLADITFDDNAWKVVPGCAPTSADTSLSDSGFTLHETGIDTGIFTGDFQIPADYCPPGAVAPESTTGLDLEVNYVDFRDASGEVIEVGDGAGIRANTGSVSFDRTVYPVPFGEVANFAAAPTATDPNGRAIFPVHLTGITAPIGAAETLGDGTVTTHIRVNDPDFDVSASGEDKIQQDRADQATGPVKITVSRGANKVTLAYAGGPVAQPGVIDVGDNNLLGAGVREMGPIVEIAPNAGIFELDFDIRYTDGPADNNCPVTAAFVATDGTAGTAFGNRFDPTAPAGNYCIIQGDILTVEYTDPTDSSGDVNSVTDSATFDLRNGVLQSDKSVYIIGSDAILTLIEPDLDLDSDSAESYDLDLIEWDSDAATVTMGDLGGNGAAFDPEPSDFRETGDNTGIFQVVVEIPNTLDNERLDRGEEIQLEYTDWGPSGADFVGDEDEDINLTIYTSNFGATVELDQKVYTWTDKVFITIVAPDHNFDSNLVDDIGNTKLDQITVATRGEKLKQYKLVETGTDTGIFTGEVILTGFPAQDADGDGTAGDATGNGPVGAGPTDGFLPADDDDGLTVSFEFTEDETVVGSALIRWNIGEVQFLEASYPATGQGVVRVVDPDMNLNPEAVDNFDVDAWSDSDAGGIDLTVTETNEATGIFEGTVHFTVTDESSGHRLRVAEGDTVTAEYEDNTLPSPYTTADELEIAATTFIGSIVPPLERAPATNPRIVDAFGNELDEVSVDQQVQITADLANGQDRDQPFAYLVQIQDEDGVTVSLSWITGSLAPGQTLNPAQSWTPTSSGTYNVQIFVWESVDNPDALSPPVSTTISVV